MRPLVLAVLLLFSLAAHANSIPTLFATRGTIVIRPEPVSQMSFVDYSFSGHGFFLSGSGTAGCSFCNGPYPRGFTLDTGLSIFSEGQDGLTIGNQSFFPLSSTGLFTTSDHAFRLPSGHQSTITITRPITFGGPIEPCLSQFPNDSGCASGAIAIINFNPRGRAKITYTREGDAWAFTSATFTLTPVPEPGTLLLLGTGMLGLGWRLRRMRG